MSAFLKDSIVSTQESQALKEMIFSRARERAAALAGDTQDSYTTSMQTEVMDVARNSFKSAKNPFSIDSFEKEPVPKKVESTAEPQIKPLSEFQDELGYTQKNIELIKSQINFTNKNVTQKVAIESINANMTEARDEFAKKTSFMGALDFLNSQATITLVRSKGKSFDAMA
jgi:hypothetical protein